MKRCQKAPEAVRNFTLPNRPSFRQLMPFAKVAALNNAMRKKGPSHTHKKCSTSPSSNIVNVDLAVALAVVFAEVEADATLLLAAVGVGLVDLGGLGEFAVGLE